MPVDVVNWSIYTCSAEARCTAREYWPVHARAGVMYLVPSNELRNHGRPVRRRSAEHLAKVTLGWYAWLQCVLLLHYLNMQTCSRYAVVTLRRLPYITGNQVPDRWQKNTI